VTEDVFCNRYAIFQWLLVQVEPKSGTGPEDCSGSGAIAEASGKKFEPERDGLRRILRVARTIADLP
jgi:hypothetical protein